MMQNRTLNPILPPKEFAKLMSRIYHKRMSVTVIKGVPQSGKTDFLLTMMDYLHNNGIIEEFATNATVLDCSWIKKIESLTALKQWGYSNSKSKFFGYDELIESTTNRRAMSDLNVAWVQNLPQISHQLMHICALVQEEIGGKRYYESVFLDPVYLRGVWYKEKRDVAVFKSHFYKEWEDGYRLRDIPRTCIKFDRDTQATFKLNSSAGLNDISLLPKTMQVAVLYARDECGYEEVKKATGLTENKQVQREIKKALRLLLQLDEGKKLTTINPNLSQPIDKIL
jgi:hypothetical protein